MHDDRRESNRVRSAASVPQARPAALTDSPWFWIYAFATAGLAGLLLIGPKYAGRQANLERNLRARQQAAEIVADRAVSAAPATMAADAEGDQVAQPSISLQPLFALLAVGVAVAWFNLIRRYRVDRVDRPKADSAAGDEGSSP